MAELIIIIVIAGLLALVIARVRSGHLHFRVADWPLGKQIESGIAVLFLVAALLGMLAGEFLFSAWLGVMAAVVAAFSILTWPQDS